MHGTHGSPAADMALSDIQRRVAALVLSLPEAHGFALAGGAALIFYEVTDRGTRDLDCFGPSLESVDLLVPAAVAALRGAGFEVNVEQIGSGFGRFQVALPDEMTLLDLGFDPAELPATATEIGAVRALRDLAGDKLLALFSRAAPRDFVDVVGLLRHFTRRELLELAAAKDHGFDRRVLADAFGVLPAIRRDRFPLDDAAYFSMLSLFATWRDNLIGPIT
jgi:Nucleotidyl transferase AbiEii toxin, Type IV TA system